MRRSNGSKTRMLVQFVRGHQLLDTWCFEGSSLSWAARKTVGHYSGGQEPVWLKIRSRCYCLESDHCGYMAVGWGFWDGNVSWNICSKVWECMGSPREYTGRNRRPRTRSGILWDEAVRRNHKCFREWWDREEEKEAVSVLQEATKRGLRKAGDTLTWILWQISVERIVEPAFDPAGLIRVHDTHSSLIGSHQWQASCLPTKSLV